MGFEELFNAAREIPDYDVELFRLEVTEDLTRSIIELQEIRELVDSMSVEDLKEIRKFSGFESIMTELLKRKNQK